MKVLLPKVTLYMYKADNVIEVPNIQPAAYSLLILIYFDYISLQYLDILVERYLHPLQSETFIPKDEVGVINYVYVYHKDEVCMKTVLQPRPIHIIIVPNNYERSFFILMCVQVEVLCGDIVQLLETQKCFLTSLKVSVLRLLVSVVK